MIVLGLDISYTRTGAVVLESTSDGDVTTVKLLDAIALKFPPSENRLAKAYANIQSEFAPGRRKGIDQTTLTVIEDPIYGVLGKNSKIIPTVSIKLAELTAVFKVWLEIRMRPYLTVSPTAVKRFITGRGDAEKVQVATEIKRRFGISHPKDPGHDFSDATALALWGILTKGTK